MTSSLVGSEMCIRDSNMLDGACFVFLKLNVPGMHVCNFPSSLRVSSCSVSYTHLTLPTICSV
eukprot:5710428-Prorocentrum_lima.AAC.1